MIRKKEQDKVRINEEIRVSEVRVIDAFNNQVGVIPIQKALKLAEEQGYDLVEVAPKATPPVCRILDYGKYLYELQKKEKESKKKQHVIEVKEIRLRPITDSHDLETKLKHAREFLEKKNKVKFTVLFRGREMAYQELGKNILLNVIQALEDIARPEGQMKVEGRRMFLVMAFKTEKGKG